MVQHTLGHLASLWTVCTHPMAEVPEPCMSSAAWPIPQALRCSPRSAVTASQCGISRHLLCSKVAPISMEPRLLPTAVCLFKRGESELSSNSTATPGNSCQSPSPSRRTARAGTRGLCSPTDRGKGSPAERCSRTRGASTTSRTSSSRRSAPCSHRHRHETGRCEARDGKVPHVYGLARSVTCEVVYKGGDVACVRVCSAVLHCLCSAKVHSRQRV
mmetsp:Transcript_4320/g.10255  ORF Transcript_4320/g.10255 Transcript_4320/m.10255 type:complete len:216 (+) Transcript_4320:139-786(+)